MSETCVELIEKLKAENERLIKCQKSNADTICDLAKDLSLAESQNTRLLSLNSHVAAENMRMREALESIAKNSCCSPCREAGLFAKSALHPVGTEGGGK